ncbi:uncharacterized protein LOC124260419 isoform X1 [Haliotis rubra]|uniref:uncharacterized protein LOC124260419 isoform X1 n=1 Tax=Haliotis rubra TaxID=36100 RepID=UPI001EE52806|nr:uncharacterized protein LOC124260419 isoform X1 [Haliotis rubra]
MDAVCGDTTNYKAVISYECISDAPIDVCNNVTQLSKQNVNRLYLASPNYPSGTNLSPGTCSCDVTGGNMSVTILEYFFLPANGVKANLTLTGDTSTWESFTAGMIAYNSLVMNSTDSLKIVFDAIPTSQKKKEVMWLKVEGSPVIHIACNGSPPPPSIIPATTDRTTHDTGSLSSLTTSNTTVAVASTSPGRTQGQPGDSDFVLMVVSSVCGMVIVLLLVIVVALFLYFKVLKPLRNSSSSPDETNEEPTCTQYDNVMQPRDHMESPVPSGDVADTQSTPGIYSGLSPYTNLDHEYGKLHVYSLVGSETTTRAEDSV